jgi:hypothetical protein
MSYLEISLIRSDRATSTESEPQPKVNSIYSTLQVNEVQHCCLKII